MFGWKARLPVELIYGAPEQTEMPQSQYATDLKTSLEKAYQQVWEKSSRALERQKEFYDKKVHGHHYQVGDYVWVLFPQLPCGKSEKLYRPWSGLFWVIKKLSDVNHWVQECKNHWRRVVIHFNRLKPYKGDVSSYQHRTRRQSPPIHTGARVPRREPHYFGTDLEIVDEDTIPVESGEERGKDPRPEADTPPSDSRRYPHDFIDPVDTTTVSLTCANVRTHSYKKGSSIVTELWQCVYYV